MARAPDEPPRTDPTRVRQGGRQKQVLAVLITSLFLAAVAAIGLYYWFYG